MRSPTESCIRARCSRSWIIADEVVRDSHWVVLVQEPVRAKLNAREVGADAELESRPARIGNCSLVAELTIQLGQLAAELLGRRFEFGSCGSKFAA